MILHRHVARRRNAVVRTGLNNAAWGQPRREVQLAVAPCYERGYAAGLVFRLKQQLDISAQNVLGPFAALEPAV